MQTKAPLYHQLRALRLNDIAAATPFLKYPHHLHDIRDEFTSWAVGASEREGFGSWQAAWNKWTRATSVRNGVIRLRAKCAACLGRGFDVRRVGRGKDGSVICAECRGHRMVNINTPARYIPAPR